MKLNNAGVRFEPGANALPVQPLKHKAMQLTDRRVNWSDALNVMIHALASSLITHIDAEAVVETLFLNDTAQTLIFASNNTFTNKHLGFN